MGSEKKIEELTRVRHIGPALAKTLISQGFDSAQSLTEPGAKKKLVAVRGISTKRADEMIASARRLAKKASKPAPSKAPPKKEAAKPAKKEAAKPAKKEAAKPAKKEAAKPPESTGTKTAEVVTPKAAPRPTVAVTKASADKTSSKKSKLAAGEVRTAVDNDTPLIERFAATLRCPSCGHEGLEFGSNALICPACGRKYGYENGVADMMNTETAPRSLTQRVMESRLYARFFEDVMRPKLTHVVTDRTLREEYVLAAELLELDDATSLLDVGCGTSNFTRYFAQRTSADEIRRLFVGLDISWPMLDEARKHLRREGLADQIFLLHGDATRMPLARWSYDRVHCAGTLHMIPEADEALRNIARVLKPGGIFVVSSFVTGEGFLRKMVKRVVELPTQFHWFGHEELLRRLERAGFEPLTDSIEGDAITIKAVRV